MGGKGSSKNEVSNYQMSLHLGLCLAPVDAITAAYYGEKQYWSGYNTLNTTYYVSKPSLFGGNKKEGGIQGNMSFLMGKTDQVIPDWFAKKLGRASGATSPGFRGFASVVHSGPAPGGKAGWFWCANSPYLKSMWYTVVAIPRSLESTMAQIGQFQGKTSLYFCLDTSGSMVTNDRIGMLKNAMMVVLQNLRNAVSSGNVKLDIGMCEFNGGGPRFWNATTADIDDLIAWVQALVPWSDTDFLAPITAAVNWFTDTANDPEITKRTNIFVTDGEPSPMWTFEPAVALAQPLLTREIDVDMHGINIDLLDTQYTAQLDNTASDGVPVVTSDDPSGLVNAVMLSVFGTVDANPAHIIFEVLTNPMIGMGLDPTVAVNVGAFNEAAKILFGESLGLSMAWSTTTTAEDFINEVRDHINAVIFPDPETGKITLKLIRDDYDKAALRTVTPDNAKLTSFGRKAWGDTINEIVVTWTNPKSEQEETVTLQDNGNIAEQGEIVSDAKNYYGVRSAALAWSLAARDLRVAAAPLCIMEVELDRSFWNLKPGDCLKVTWPEYGISSLVMRVWEVKYGKRNSSRIVASLTEDVFSLPVSAFVKPPDTEWVDTSQQPKAPTASKVITLPPYVVASVAGTGLASFEYPVAYAGVLADDPNGDTASFDLIAETHDVTGAVVWEQRGTLPTAGYGKLRDSLAYEATSSVQGLASANGTQPGQAIFMLIGSGGDADTEWALIMSVASGVFSVKRGLFDTVPRAWPAGTPVWYFTQDFSFAETTPQSDGSHPKYKALMNTSMGQLSATAAFVLTGGLDDRLQAPYRPADVKVNGMRSDSIAVYDEADTSITWATRNRLSEETVILGWADPAIPPETGQTTRINFYNSSSVLVHHIDGIVGSEVSFVAQEVFSQLSEGYLEVVSERGGITSLQGRRVGVTILKSTSLNFVFGPSEVAPGMPLNFQFQ